jgi:hypothetical protein
MDFYLSGVVWASTYRSYSKGRSILKMTVTNYAHLPNSRMIVTLTPLNWAPKTEDATI